MIMKEYLSTTSLGDLVRKAKDIEITPRETETTISTTPENNTSNVTTETSIGGMTPVIRSRFMK